MNQRSRMTRLAAVAAVAVGCPLQLVGQHYHVATYTAVEGLPSYTVRSIVQAPNGIMWLGTRAGIVSFDGAHWKLHQQEDDILSGGALLALDDRGALWAVRDMMPMCAWRLESGLWQQVTDEDMVWGDARLTALLCLPEDIPGELIVRAVGGQLAVLEGSAWHTIDFAGAGGSTARAIVRMADDVFIVTDRQVLRWRGRGVPPEVVVNAGPGMLLGAAADPVSNQLWLIGRDGIGHASEGGLEIIQPFDRQQLGAQYEFTALCTSRGRLYFGEPSSLYMWAPGEPVTALGLSNGLISDGVISLFEDREGVVWIGSYRGLSKFINHRFTSYDQRDGLVTDEVSVVFQRRSGCMVLGGPTGLTHMLDPPASLRLADHPEIGRVMDIAEDDLGFLWVAVNWRGLARIDDHGRVRWFGPDHGLDEVVTSAVVHDGRLWVGTRNGVYVRTTADKFEPVAGVPSTYIRRVVADPSGGVYVATGERGVYHVRGADVQHIAHPTRSEANNTYAVCVDPRGTVWVGTRAGLFKIDGHTLVEVERSGPAVERPVYFVLVDNCARLWCGTDRGVRVWDGQTTRAFSVADGLIGAECNRAAGCCATDGTVWIGTERGVSVFNPREDDHRVPAPLVGVIGVDAGGESFDAHEDVVLAHDRNAIAFGIRAISFVDERAVRIRTRLEGLEPEWGAYAALPERRVQFPYLPPGAYRLHVQALSVEGQASEAITSPWIVIAPPFWRATWFIGAVVLVGVIFIFCIGMLVSKRRHAARLEQQVAERTADLQTSRALATTEKERLGVTLASINEGVAATDERGVIVMWNAAAERLTGIAASSAGGRPLLEVMPLAIEDTSAWLSEVLRGASTSITDTCSTYVSGDGRRYEIEFSAAPLRVGAQIRGAVVAFRDVTARRRRDHDLATTERLNSLGVLAGGIAHDFNNLLTVVISSLSMIDVSATLAPDMRGPLGEAQSASERARNLSRRLLTFARGGAPLRQAVAVKDLVCDRVVSLLDWTTVQCTVDLPDDLWPLDVDPTQMAQVINNLVLNARQAMTGGGAVHISARNLAAGPPSLPAGRYVSVRVADDGPGIASADIDHIFDPFYTTGDDRSGLGLSVAYSIVERHDGLLTVESRPGAGATFEILLPAGRSSPATQCAHDEVKAAVSGARVLLMDDHPAVRQVVSTTLVSLGFEVESATDGREAVDLYRRAFEGDAPFAAVILDLTVRGGMGGDEAVGLLREVDPDVRAIAASGYAEDPIMANAEAYGFCDRLVKPFGAPELSEVLGRVVHNRNQPPGRSER